MLAKQDRIHSRTPSDVERKYNLGQLASNQNSGFNQSDIERLNQSLAQYMANTNAIISDLIAKIEDEKSQNIILTARGQSIVLTDSATHTLVSLKIYGNTGVEISKVWTTNADGSEKTEAVLSASVTLNADDVLSDGQITRADGTIEDLPDTDKKALESLKTFKTTTNIYNDSTVKPIIEVEYVADMKTYIDNKVTT